MTPKVNVAWRTQIFTIVKLSTTGRKHVAEKIQKNTELTIRFIGAVYDHVFVSKHVPSDGYRTFGKSYDMAVSFQRLLTNQSTKADLVLLRHEHIESAIEKKVQLKNHKSA